MDPLTTAALTAALLAVWSYATYLAVRRGVRDALLDRDREKANRGPKPGDR